MQNVKPSEIKTELYGFNDCPTRHEISEALTAVIPNQFRVVDGSKDSWQNCSDTLVFQLEKVTFSPEAVVAFAANIQNLRVDEFNFDRTTGGNVIVRLWWD